IERFLKYFNDQIARMTKVLYQDQRQGNQPQLNVNDFVNLIEYKDPKLQGFFDVLYNAMNPKEKSQKVQKILKQKIMVFCYQMAELRNKQVSGSKTSIGLFFAKSGASAHCINTAASMGLCTMYQTASNKLNKISNEHYFSIQKYIRIHSNNLLIACVDDYHNLHGTRIPSTTSIKQIAHMATILFNTIEALPIPYNSPNNLSIHNPRDCVESELKNTKNYVDAVKIFLSLLEIKEYLMNYVIPLPADFSGQLFIRKAITMKLMFNELTIFEKKQKLATKPRPWRINLLLYLAHEGWLMIKTYIVQRFKIFKDIAYVTFFDLLDNLIPAVLDVYTCLFWENHFEEYVSTIFRLLRRHTNAKTTTGKLLRRDALFLDYYRHETIFINSFESQHDYSYTKRDLDVLTKPLPLGYHSNYYPKIFKLCDYSECDDLLWNNGRVLICGHELSQSYNERLRIKKDINDWIDSNNQSETEPDTLENIESTKEYDEVNKKLQRKIA
ncbi:17325_t:CDS:2, partial [Racocetra persica]